MPENHVLISFKGELQSVDVREILYIQGNGRSNTIYTVKVTYHTELPLKELVVKLAPNNFVRIHKSYIIPLSRVRSFKPRCVIMKEIGPHGSDLELPIGRTYKDIPGTFRSLQKSRKKPPQAHQSVTCQNSHVALTF